MTEFEINVSIALHVGILVLLLAGLWLGSGLLCIIGLLTLLGSWVYAATKGVSN